MKRSRTYWIQLCYPDERPDEWLEAFSSYNDTCVIAGGLLEQRDAEFVLVLRPWVKKGACAAEKDILAELEREARPGAQVIQITL
jgi:hypothetical protein